MKRSAPISFLGMREARKVDSFSLKSAAQALSAPPPPPPQPTREVSEEEQGIAEKPLRLNRVPRERERLRELSLRWKINGRESDVDEEAQ